MFYFEFIIRCELRSAEIPSKWGVSKQYLCNVRNIYTHSNYILLCSTSVCRLPNALPDASRMATGSRMSANLKPQFPYKMYKSCCMKHRKPWRQTKTSKQGKQEIIHKMINSLVSHVGSGLDRRRRSMIWRTRREKGASRTTCARSLTSSM